MLEMVVFTTNVLETSPRENELFNFLPLSEALRMLIQVTKACSRNHNKSLEMRQIVSNSPATVPGLTGMTVRPHSISALKGLPIKATRYAGFPGIYLVHTCRPSLFSDRIPFQSVSKELHTR